MRARATAMLERVAAEARAALGPDGAAVVRAALADALAPRDRAIADDHDPRLLHTARTIRILLADAACRSVAALAAAAFVDTIDARLVAEPPPALRTIVAAVPHAGPGADDEWLLERIVTADHDVAVLALAERLDHARHLHLRTDLDARAFHAQVRTVYAPAAHRFDAHIARRFDRWADAFERRLILPR